MTEKKKINTTKTIINASAKIMDEQIRKLPDIFQKQKRVGFSIPSALAKAVGNIMLIGVNGSFLEIPADGEIYEIPESFAKHGQRTIKNLKN